MDNPTTATIMNQKAGELPSTVSELDFDTELMSAFEFANHGSNFFAAAISKSVALLQIDPKTGELKEVKRIEADFHEKDPEVAKVRWSNNNKLIVSGGADGFMRIFKVISNDSGIIMDFELQTELGQHSKEINDVALNPDNSLAISASIDKTCRIYSLKDNK